MEMSVSPAPGILKSLATSLANDCGVKYSLKTQRIKCSIYRKFKRIVFR